MGRRVPCINCEIGYLMWSASSAEEWLRCREWLGKYSVRTVSQTKGLMISLSDCEDTRRF